MSLTGYSSVPSALSCRSWMTSGISYAAARDPDRVGLLAGVVFVPQDVRPGQPGEHVQPRRAHRMVVEPHRAGRLLRCLVGVGHRLRLPGSEAVRGGARVAVVGRRDEGAVQVRQEPHLVPQRGQPGIDRYPGRVRPGQVVGVADRDRGAGRGGDRHPERTRLPGQPGAVVVRPHRGRGQIGVQVTADLPQREGIPVRCDLRRHHDAVARQRDRLRVLPQPGADRGRRPDTAVCAARATPAWPVLPPRRATEAAPMAPTPY